MALPDKRPRRGGKTVSSLLLNALGGAIECGDLATMNAAGDVVGSRVRGCYEDLRDLWGKDEGGDFVEWLLIASPGVERQLKKATGLTREEWLWLV